MNKVDELIGLITKAQEVPSEMRLFLISEKRMARIYRGRRSVGASQSSFGLVLPNHLIEVHTQC